MDHHVAALAVRWLHVAAMSTILGGALLVWWLAVRGPSRAVVDVAVRYEQVFWAALGVIVMTGVGNLGAFGLALPAPATTWGGTFMAKITLVAVLVALSLPRSLAVARIGVGATSTASLRWLYSATATAIALISALAIWLAHG
jgi:hypothetical protein